MASEPVNKKYIMRKYNVLSKVYNDLYSEEQLRKYKYALAHLDKSDVESRVILDAGCGTALLLEFLSETFKPSYFIGIDLSIEMLKVAKKVSVRTLYDFILGDIDYVPLRDKSVETAFCFTVFHDLMGIERTIKELHRVTCRKVILSILKHSKITCVRSFLTIIETPEEVKDYILIFDPQLHQSSSTTFKY